MDSPKVRTTQEIIEKAREVAKESFLGFGVTDLISFLSFEEAKEFLNDDATPDKWGEIADRSIERVKQEMVSYLEFAWGKANDCRGLSAGRSIEHFEAWLWMCCDDEAMAKFQAIEYEHYGKEKLVFITEYLGEDPKKYDNGIRTNFG